ncbi:MAG: lytic transglycosylase domain-containing protein [Bacteroidales bacterium]|nr:lytic transglycosylase domain-containing protein [Bacteroidales bacterium]
MKKLSIAAIVLASLAIAGEIFIFAAQREDSEAVQQRAIMADYRVYAPVIPDTMSFAGERVPLERYYVREGLDNELIINMYRQSSTVLYFKRANRYFPIIEPILKRNGIPEDMKYLCVIESGLTNATSPAKAQGFWQFIPSTAGKYGLLVNDEIDMRNNLEASTEAACKYLRSLYNRFHSWSAAAAAYNCGENGLARRIESQGVSDYYDIRLNTETSRYVYRILAVKLIMQHPQQYGYHMRHCDLYPTIPTRSVTLSGQNVDLYKFAKNNGTTYKMLRDLNPWIQTDMLKNKANKSYTVQLPIENGTLQKTLTKGQRNTRLITEI